MFSLKRRIYEHAPLVVKRAIGGIPFRMTAGRAYRIIARNRFQIDLAPSTKVIEFQKRALQRLLEYATEHVPAYRAYRLPKGNTHDAVSWLLHFPLLNKDYLRERFSEFTSDSVPPWSRWIATTGGTTGEQLRFILDDEAQSREMAFIHSLWARVGYRPNCRKATFRGVDFPHAGQDYYWQYNPIYNELQFSPFHLNGETFSLYEGQIRRYAPEFLHGYPSAICLLAQYLLDAGRRLSVKAVLLGSEAVYDDQRARIEEAFQCRVYSWYGHSERVILAGECEQSVAYHEVPDYGWLEILDESGKPVEEGAIGELVGTGFWNMAMPLIRYRTGDRVRKLTRHCECGRSVQRFDRVEGRWEQDYVIGRTGARISVAALNMHGPFYDHVRRYQYYQDNKGELELRVMPTPEFSDKDVNELLQKFKRRVGDELAIKVVRVSDLPLTNRGKLRRLIQAIPNNQQCGMTT
jgi:phenylacetate-coenzyme A ligase PaaK-like adenylate-forming protein